MALTFNSEMAPFAVGRRVNSEEWNSITRTYEDDNDDDRLGFGMPVTGGTGKHSCVLVSATGQNFLGITEAMPMLPRPGDGYARYDNVPICDMGVIAVPCEGNVTKGAQARFNFATSKWTAAAQSATVATIPGVQFEETATAPGVTPVRVRRPVPALTVAA